ncbi:hypothetical protein [Dakarella massiliensis]|uniref:hypothetical protein n=1 Tax=Dakarella massiliensis TaxID=1506471 RepID=UPI003A913F7F
MVWCEAIVVDAPQRYPVRRREGRAVVLPGELAANRAGQVSLFGKGLHIVPEFSFKVFLIRA